MRAADFDTVVTFQKKIRVPNGGGGHVADWPEEGDAGNAKRWAAVWSNRQSTSDEEVDGSRVANAADYRLIVRSDSFVQAVTHDWRVLIGGQPYAIKSVALPDRVRGTITMIIQEGQPT